MITKLLTALHRTWKAFQTAADNLAARRSVVLKDWPSGVTFSVLSERSLSWWASLTGSRQRLQDGRDRLLDEYWIDPAETWAEAVAGAGCGDLDFLYTALTCADFEKQDGDGFLFTFRDGSTLERTFAGGYILPEPVEAGGVR